MAAFIVAVPEPDLDAPRVSDGELLVTTARPAWFAFHYSLPDAAARAAVWRVLKDLDALNVQRSVWAVRGDTGPRDRLERLADQIRESGGRASLREVGTASSDDMILQSRLDRACERLWDDFVNQADWYRVETTADRPRAERLRALTDLSTTFGAIVGLDIVRSAATRRAEDTMRHLIDDLGADGGVDAYDWCRSLPTLRRRIDLVTSCPLTDGRRAFVARPHPVVDPLWQVAFQRFEASTYQPSAERIPLLAGTFRWIGDPGTSTDALTALDERVQRFDAAFS